MQPQDKAAHKTCGESMSEAKAHLEEMYKEKSTEELISLHRQGHLTDFAYSILESELTSRGENIPERPEEPVFVEKPTPVWFRIGAFAATILLINFFWVAIAKPIVGGGFIPQAAFVFLPTIFLWKKFFPKKPKSQ